MRKSNKVISAMLSVLMVSGMFTAMPLAVNAAGTADTNETTTSASVQSADDTQSDSEEKEYNGFTYYTRFNEENNRTEAVITGYKGIDNDLVIPDSIDNAVVTSIGVKAFAESNQFESITIPDSIGSIGEDAFWECNGLKKVYVSSIEDWCKIKFEDISSNPIVYAREIYIDGELATDITIPKGITKICDYAFVGCDTITNVVIPNSVISIGNSAFFDCSNLKNISIPNSVISIGDSAFYHCYNLKNISIPNSVVNIGAGAFSGCSNLEEVEIPDGIKFIKDSTFAFCENLTTIIIPQSVKEIGNLAFYRDSSNYLSNVLFKGSKSQWDSIHISGGYTDFFNSVIHYDVKFVEKKAPTCVEKGYDLYSCSECSDGVKINCTDPLGHNVVSGICERCGKPEDDCFESAHPYNNDSDESWTIYKKNATRIAVVFSNSTETEANYDYIYLYDKNGEEIGKYSGTELADKKITVLGDTVKIRLVSDGLDTLYGFSLSNIVPYYDECLHSSTRLENEMSPTCVEEGYTGDLICNNCEAFLKKGEVIPATGNHEYIDGVCKICGAISLENFPSISGNETQNVIIEDTDVSKYFKFTPSQSGSLTFYSTGSCDPFGRLLDSNMTELAYNDDNGEDRNFRISYNVNARETYVLQIGAFISSDEAFNVTFNFEPNKETLLGDVNGDGEITVVDATILQKYIVGQTTLDDETLNVADVNKDGAVTVVDATLIQKFVVKMITEF
ncbi:leucine-rich repeat protein [Ruminococcus sp.]|uniref:leucine-rich repeat protein n=1 Tax=Ruminococcus sp. TaxID=41978 RepID=UPI0025EA0268|nr:leucine-rich repeat protein [Ruminococcus sp.]